MTVTDLLLYGLWALIATGAIVWSGLLFLAVVATGRGLAWLLRLVLRRPARSEVSL